LEPAPTDRSLNRAPTARVRTADVVESQKIEPAEQAAAKTEKKKLSKKNLLKQLHVGSAPLHWFKLTAGINGILPASGGPLPFIPLLAWANYVARWKQSLTLALIIAALGSPRTAKIKHQSQTGEVLSDVGQNESKIKRNKFPAGLDKVVGFIEAQGFNPGNRPPGRRALKGRQVIVITDAKYIFL
jgi:hypothetical protein